MRELDEMAADLARALEDAGLDYAIGGAIALGFHAVPRGTLDIDLNVFIPMEEARRGLVVLHAAGVELDVEESARSAAADGDARGRLEGVRIDIFFDSIPLHGSARGRRQPARLAGRPVWILSAEDLVLLKLFFDRPKDHVDIERIVAIQGDAFDATYARRQLIDHLGEDDHRVEALDRLLEAP